MATATLSENTAQYRLFDAFQRSAPLQTTSSAAVQDIRLKLLFDDMGAYVEVINAKGKPCEVDYRCCQGAMRELLKAISSIRERQEMLIDWEAEDEHIYLHEHSHLLWLIRASDVLHDAKGKPIRFEDGPAEIRLLYAPDAPGKDGWLRAKLQLLHQNSILTDTADLQIISETYVLLKNTIYETKPIGENCRSLILFTDAIPATLLERSLSLLFSHFTGISVRYESFKIAQGEPVQAGIALIFQQVDETGALHLDLTHTLPRLPLEFVPSGSARTKPVAFASSRARTTSASLAPVSSLTLPVTVSSNRNVSWET